MHTSLLLQRSASHYNQTWRYVTTLKKLCRHLMHSFVRLKRLTLVCWGETVGSWVALPSACLDGWIGVSSFLEPSPGRLFDALPAKMDEYYVKVLPTYRDHEQVCQAVARNPLLVFQNFHSQSLSQKLLLDVLQVLYKNCHLLGYSAV
jgi:hypothetical protein